MPYIHEVITASNIASFAVEIGTKQQQLLGARLFPARKQLGLKWVMLKVRAVNQSC